MQEPTSITSSEAFLFHSSEDGLPGELQFVLFSDGPGGDPDERLFEERVVIPNTDKVAAWHGVSNLNWQIDPGAYWLGLVVDERAQLAGVMPDEDGFFSHATASPEPPEIGGYAWIHQTGPRIGFRAMGETIPEPTTFSYWILVLAFYLKRHSKRR